MSTPISNLAVMLSGSTQPMVQDMKQAEGALNSFEQAGLKMNESLAKLTAQGAAFGLGMLGIHSIMESFKHGYEIAEQNEKAAVSFKVLLGSAEAARDMLKEIRGFAGESGMKFGDARSGAASLLRMGFDREDIRPMLKILGDVGATSFEGMEASMQKNITMLGVIKDQGFLTARNMKALAMEGIEPWEALSKAMGKSKIELKAMLEAGQIDASTGIVAILTAMQDKFAGGLQENAKTLTFQLEKMKSTTAGIFADVAGIAIEMSHAESWLPDLNKGLGNFRKELSSGQFWKSTKQAIFSLFGDSDQVMQIEKNWQYAKKAADETERAAQAEKIRVDQLKLAESMRWTQVVGTDQQKEYEEKLALQMKQFGMTEKQKELEKMIGQAPDSGAAALIRYRAGRLEEMEAQNKLMEEGKKITEAMLTPEEKLAEEVIKMTKLLDAGAISQETYNRKMEQASPVLQEFMRQTKSLREEIDKLALGENEAMLKKLMDAGGTSAQRKQIEELLKQRDVLKENKALQQDAQKAIEDQLDPAERLREQFEKAREKYLAGVLDTKEFEALANKYGSAYLGTLKEDQQPRFAGAIEAGSREAYSALVAASGSGMSAQELAQKQLDQAVIAAENQKRLLEQQGRGGKEIVDELKRINSFKVFTLGGPSS